LPRLAEQPWSFIKVKGTLEGGMPHTRGPHIILPAPIFAPMRQLRGAGPGSRPFHSILVHEQVHVVERAHPEWFTKLYTDVLGFRRAEAVASHPWIDARQIVNPDGPDLRWVMPIESDDGTARWIWPRLLFSGPDATSFAGMQKAGIEVEPDGGEGKFKPKLGPDGVPVHQQLDKVKAYAGAARTRQSSYHPNEIAADLLAAIVTSPELSRNESLKPVRAWAKEALGAP
jgi:hypothetical protein